MGSLELHALKLAPAAWNIVYVSFFALAPAFHAAPLMNNSFCYNIICKGCSGN